MLVWDGLIARFESLFYGCGVVIQTLPVARSEPISLPSTHGIVHPDDAALLDGLAAIGAAQRRVEATHAVFAAEVARRSDRRLGQSGLAARSGFARVEELLQSVTGVSRAVSGSLVVAGELLAGVKPWLAPVARAVASGELSVAAGAAIAGGLGDPDAEVSADALVDAAVALVDASVAKPSADSSTVVPPEQARIDARRVRAELDAASVTELEAHRYSRRSLRHGLNADGTVWGRFVADPDSGAIILDALRTITAPRHVAFRDTGRDTDASSDGRSAADPSAADASAADPGERSEPDPRTREQRDFDAFIAIIKLGASTKDEHLFGHNDATVRVHVAAESLVGGDGVAWIEGQDELQPATVAQRIACTAGIIPIIIGDRGSALNVGRAQRLFTTAQRIALAARDGGCLHPGCRVPARFTEAHHITPWSQGGRTDLADGVLLCRFHHRMVHAQRWRIRRDTDATYWLEPPPGSTATRRRLTSKTPSLRPRVDSS